MASITIFGTGGMGTAIGQLLTGGGSTVHYVTKSDDATITDDIVILAVPYESLESIVDEYADQLVGKTVVDITNPLDFETFDALKVPVDSSAAAGLQSALPHSRVVKAFNTTFAATLNAKTVGPNATTVLVAGDDTSAKQALVEAVTASGLNADRRRLARAGTPTRGSGLPPAHLGQRREGRVVRRIRRRRVTPGPREPTPTCSWKDS